MFITYNRILAVLVILHIAISGHSQQFESSVYMNHRLIEDKDVTVLDTIVFQGWSIIEVFDRRIPEYTNAVLAIYKVTWLSGESMEVHVLKEFYEVKSVDEVLNESVFPFAYKVGQLPHFLLEGINRIVLLKGKELCSAALGSIYIHVEEHDDASSDFVEEMLLHEGGHASMDEKIRDLSEWKSAQRQDSISISKYGSDNLDTEDLTESLIAWLAIRYRHRRISSEDSLRIVETMPARLAFFDGLKLDVAPLDKPTEFDHLYEVPRHDEYYDELDGMMSFGEFMIKLFLVILAILAFFLIRYVIRNAGF